MAVGEAAAYSITKLGAVFANGLPLIGTIASMVQGMIDFAIKRKQLMDIHHLSKIALLAGEPSPLVGLIARTITLAMKDQIKSLVSSPASNSQILKGIAVQAKEYIEGGPKTNLERQALEKTAKIIAFLLSEESRSLATPGTKIQQVVDEICKALNLTPQQSQSISRQPGASQPLSPSQPSSPSQLLSSVSSSSPSQSDMMGMIIELKEKLETERKERQELAEELKETKEGHKKTEEKLKKTKEGLKGVQQQLDKKDDASGSVVNAGGGKGTTSAQLSAHRPGTKNGKKSTKAIVEDQAQIVESFKHELINQAIKLEELDGKIGESNKKPGSLVRNAQAKPVNDSQDKCCVIS